MAAAAALGEDVLAVAQRRRLDAFDAGDARHVRGDVLGVGAREDVGGHVDLVVVGVALVDGAGVRDLVLDDALDRVLVHAVGAGLRERGVEIGPDAAPSVRASVSAWQVPQPVGEEIAAAIEVGLLLRVAASGERSRNEDERGDDDRLPAGD